MTTTSHHLHNERTSLVFDLSGPVPRVAYWGAPINDDAVPSLLATSVAAHPVSSIDQPRQVSIFPSEVEGWSGLPGVELVREGRDVHPRWHLTETAAQDTQIEFQLRDDSAQSTLRARYTVEPSGLISVANVIVNESTAFPLTVRALRASMPTPARATEGLDFTGRWGRESLLQARPLTDGQLRRQGRRGRPGHDTPHLLAATAGPARYRSGELWAVHLAWSGETDYTLERLPEGVGVDTGLLSVTELLRQPEGELAAGQSYHAPRALFAHSTAGLDDLTSQYHQHVRAHLPKATRPLVLNTWEAVYFNHDLDRLTDLVRAAERVGVERFVLDDGWFLGRRDDTRGLGDWVVDSSVWPDGLHTLRERVREAGMQFGLWFEPEMVNFDSDVARAHPEWVLAPNGYPGPSSRQQYLLNLAHPDAYAHIRDQMDALISEYDIDFIKWDHNRDLHEAVDRRTDAPAVHAQTLAVYRLMDELLASHPELEIESCASGGGRADLGILTRTNRVWTSDSNDALERQRIQMGTVTLLPLEVLGAHVGPPKSHTTGRVADLSFRMATALLGHSGIEWDLTSASDEDIEHLKAWTNLYKRIRPLIATGTLVRADLPDTANQLYGVVTPDRGEGYFIWAALTGSDRTNSVRVRLPGLDPDSTYQVTALNELGTPSIHSTGDVPWVRETHTIHGTVLTEIGIPLPILNPEQALTLHVVRH